MKPQLILLGAPGSGKGTQANMLITEYGYSHVSTGDLLRSEVSRKTDLGIRISEIMSSGKLVDDKTVLEVLASNCDLSISSYIFDGYPRNFEQAVALDEEIVKNHKAVAVYFDADLDNISERLIARRTCSKCGEIYNLITKIPSDEKLCDKCNGELTHRKDDTAEVVKQRMQIFKDSITPILQHYEDKGILKRVDATRPLDEVAKSLIDVINL